MWILASQKEVDFIHAVASHSIRPLNSQYCEVKKCKLKMFSFFFETPAFTLGAAIGLVWGPCLTSSKAFQIKLADGFFEAFVVLLGTTYVLLFPPSLGKISRTVAVERRGCNSGDAQWSQSRSLTSFIGLLVLCSP